MQQMEQSSFFASGAETTSSPFLRMWHSFLTGRVALAIILLVLVLGKTLDQGSRVYWPVALCAVYVFVTGIVSIYARARIPPPELGLPWAPTVGVDLCVFAILQWYDLGGINYTVLFGVPVLMTSSLGTRLHALAIAACTCLILLIDAGILFMQKQGSDGAFFLQVAWTCVGFFSLALLVHQLSSRLLKEGIRSRHSQADALLMQRVNMLIVEHFPDGILVVNSDGEVQSANVMALELLDPTGARGYLGQFSMKEESAWSPLFDIVAQTFSSNASKAEEVILQSDQGQRVRLHVRTRLTFEDDDSGGGLKNLCVIFIRDLREMEARLRMEKLAAMGRMSAAVAHEIRNPLAAVSQANALLDEDVETAAQKRLTGIISHNVVRIQRTVDDVLDVARTQSSKEFTPSEAIDLDLAVASICEDWQTHSPPARPVAMKLGCSRFSVLFSPEHLRRLLVNLLDNAQRYASQEPCAIQVITRMRKGKTEAELEVWSDGAPLERTVESHLFEPFFSSESRSSGLGLYICRELCGRHDATIAYQRVVRDMCGKDVGGNAFIIKFAPRLQGA